MIGPRQTGGPCDTLKKTQEQKEQELIQAELDRQASRQALADAELAYAAALERRDSAADAYSTATDAWVTCITSHS